MVWEIMLRHTEVVYSLRVYEPLEDAQDPERWRRGNGMSVQYEARSGSVGYFGAQGTVDRGRSNILVWMDDGAKRARVPLVLSFGVRIVSSSFPCRYGCNLVCERRLSTRVLDWLVIRERR